MRAWLALVLLLCGCDQVFGLERPPPDALMPGTWAEITTGDQHACGIRVDQSLWCWGHNDVGQLGLGAGAGPQPVPVQVGTAQWTTLSSHASTTCGLQVDGSLWCWGRNSEAIVGDGTAIDRSEPTRIGSTTWQGVAVGQHHACALAAGSTAWCWGSNSNGQLGVGDLNARMAPTAVTGSKTWTAIVVGDRHTCALASDQTAWCWGDNGLGQLGNGGDSLFPALAPTRVTDQLWSTLAAGGFHTCGRLVDGRLRCWGANSSGQLGVGGVPSTQSPTALDVDAPDWAPLIAAGAQHTCAVKIDGALWCWGDNSRGETGGPRITSSDPVPHPVLGGPTSWARIAAAGPTCGIGDDHNLWCLGLGGQAANAISTPARLAGTWRSAEAGTTSICGIDDTGALSCWGNNSGGQLGDSSFRPSASPKQIADPSWVSVSVGASSACAIREGGALSCWGTTIIGLGDGSVNRLAPAPISGRAWTAVTVGNTQTCAIEAGTGHLYGWGSNFYGELGTGVAMSEPMPVQITTQVWTSIAAGNSYTCGVGTAGLQCFGINGFGNLGTGDLNLRLTPTVIGTADTVVTRTTHSCAIAGTTLSCWGNNTSGQLGDGTRTESPLPKPLTGQWLQVAIGAVTSCAIAADHSLACWGDNSQGEVGDGGMEADRLVPTQVGDRTTWQSVTVGDSYACAIDADGAMWCWGDNSYGQLGLGIELRTAPVLVE